MIKTRIFIFIFVKKFLLDTILWEPGNATILININATLTPGRLTSTCFIIQRLFFFRGQSVVFLVSPVIHFSITFKSENSRSWKSYFWTIIWLITTMMVYRVHGVLTEVLKILSWGPYKSISRNNCHLKLHQLKFLNLTSAYLKWALSNECVFIVL